VFSRGERGIYTVNHLYQDVDLGNAGGGSVTKVKQDLVPGDGLLVLQPRPFDRQSWA
jgi:hypothetical protein